MTADELYKRRTTHLAEIASIRADLCDCLGGEMQHLRRIHKVRQDLYELGEKLQEDLDDIIAILQEVEREKAKNAIVAKICELKGEIEKLEAQL